MHAPRFDIERSKESTGRVVVFRELGIHHSYTLEASLCGSSDPPAPPPDMASIRDEQLRTPPPMAPHYTSQDLQGVGADLCRTIADYAALAENGWGCHSETYRIALSLVSGSRSTASGKRRGADA